MIKKQQLLRLILDDDLTHKLQISLRCSRGDLRGPRTRRKIELWQTTNLM